MLKLSFISDLSIRKKIVLGTLLVACSFCIILLIYSQLTANYLLNQTAEKVFVAETQKVNLKLQQSYGPVERATTILAYSRLDQVGNTEHHLDMVPWFAQVLEKLPTATAIQVGSENGSYFIVRIIRSARLKQEFNSPESTRFVADYLNGVTRDHTRYYFNNKNKLLAQKKLEETNYDPRIRPWYKKAMASNETVATSPYIFFFMKQIGITLGRSNESKTLVIATDITLDSISKSLKDNPITPSSASLLHIDQKIIAWSGQKSPLVRTTQGKLRQLKLSELEHPIFSQLNSNNVPEGWLVRRSQLHVLTETPIELIITIPEAELLTDFSQIKYRTILVSIILLLLIIPVSWLFANRISKPLTEVHKSILDVGSGDFNFKLPSINSKDEVGDLVTALTTMRNSLKDHIAQLANETATRERLESELNIARKIQMGMVPGSGKLSASLSNYNINAKLHPARAVGGDLYIVTTLPNGDYFIAVGDVSDKGVPAALFMSRAVSLAKILVPKSQSLSQVLGELNNELSKENDECMFITFICAIITPHSETIHYACAGHNPPAIIKRNGNPEYIDLESGTPLGLFPDAQYTESTMNLKKGERLVIYTDGITEAFNSQKEEFSEERLLKILKDGDSSSIESLSKSVLDEVKLFAGKEPQSDDITLLILENV